LPDRDDDSGYELPLKGSFSSTYEINVQNI